MWIEYSGGARRDRSHGFNQLHMRSRLEPFTVSKQYNLINPFDKNTKAARRAREAKSCNVNDAT